MTRPGIRTRRPLLALVLALSATACGTGTGSNTAPGPPRFDVGRPATPAEVAAWDTDVNGEGAGLPPGRGTAPQGAALYQARCAACHGPHGEGGPLGAQLIKPSAPGVRPRRNVGTHWPYAPPLFDYIRRTMPPNRPWSLRDDEVYALVAYLLAENAIVPPTFVVDRDSLARVRMPARNRFIADDRRGGADVK